MIRRIAAIAAGASVSGGCSPHQSRESFETGAVIILAALIGLAFWINHQSRN